MTDRVLIPLPGVGTLVLPRDVYETHLVTQATPSAQKQPAGLVDADQLEERTGVPASWWMAQARERRVPFRKIGRRVRFDLAEVMACDAFTRRAIPAGAVGHADRLRCASD